MPERFAAARSDGFDAVEILVTEGVTVDVLADSAAGAGIGVAMCNVSMGDFPGGGVGLSGVPTKQAEFRKAVVDARTMAEKLACRKIHIGPSRVPAGIDHQACMDCLAENLYFAANCFAASGIETLIEPLNNIDTPDICLSRVSDAIALMDETALPNVCLQFDVYHAAQMEANYIDLLSRYIQRVGHIQFADVPGRGEPGSGNIDFEALFARIDALGYSGWVGAEYQPSKPASETLTWLQSESASAH